MNQPLVVDPANDSLDDHDRGLVFTITGTVADGLAVALTVPVNA